MYVTATMLPRDGIVVIKFTKSRKLPRHCSAFCLQIDRELRKKVTLEKDSDDTGDGQY